MPQEQARVLARSGNIAVTHVEGRSHPGLHIQGDTLAETYRSMHEAARRLRTTGVTGEPIEDLEYTLAERRSMLRFYETTLAAGGARPPYAPLPS